MNAVNTNTGAPVTLPKILDTSTIVNSNVTNDHGENLGKISKLILDMETGKITYAVLDFTDLTNRVLAFSGLPNRTKYFAVPWELFDYSPHDKKLILNVPRDLLVKSPGYDTLAQAAYAADFYWLGEAYEYYSNKTEWNRVRTEERDAEVLMAQKKREEINHAHHPQ